MSQENVEVVRRLYEAFQRGAVDEARAAFHPDVEWDGTNLPDGRIGRGHEAVLDHISRWSDTWENWTVEVEEVVGTEGDQVLVVIREQGRSKSGVDVDERHAEVYAVKEGRIVARRGFADPGEAFEAVGLRE